MSKYSQNMERIYLLYFFRLKIGYVALNLVTLPKKKNVEFEGKYIKYIIENLTNKLLEIL